LLGDDSVRRIVPKPKAGSRHFRRPRTRRAWKRILGPLAGRIVLVQRGARLSQLSIRIGPLGHRFLLQSWNVVVSADTAITDGIAPVDELLGLHISQGRLAASGDVQDCLLSRHLLEVLRPEPLWWDRCLFPNRFQTLPEDQSDRAGDLLFSPVGSGVMRSRRRSERT
jgi:hypothetical protein